MRVLVDTPIWSLALRRSPKKLSPDQHRLLQELTELIQEHRLALLGPIRQEVLSGIREQSEFLGVRAQLREFPDEPVITEDYEEAARITNQCLAAGIAGSSIDFLVCAVALRRKWPVFTLDKDFQYYARHIPLALHTPQTRGPEGGW